jgi:hypothetical protein
VNFKIYSLVSIMASNSSTTIMTQERKERLTLDYTNMTKMKIKYSKDSSSASGSGGGSSSSSRRKRRRKRKVGEEGIQNKRTNTNHKLEPVKKMHQSSDILYAEMITFLFLLDWVGWV